MSNTLFSVVIPCFNQGRYLPSALESVASQTFDSWECIIVNDGSSDETEYHALSWIKNDKRFRYIKQANLGPSKARNAAISIASGEYLQFLDADDLLEDNKLMMHSRHIEESVDISISGYRYFRDGSDLSSLRILGVRNYPPEVVITRHDTIDLCDLLAGRNAFVICAPVYRKSLIDSIGGFDDALGAFEDQFLNLRLALANATFDHFGYHLNTKALVRLHSKSMSQNLRYMNSSQQAFRMRCLELPEFKHRYTPLNPKGFDHVKAKVKDIMRPWVPPAIWSACQRLSAIKY